MSPLRNARAAALAGRAIPSTVTWVSDDWGNVCVVARGALAEAAFASDDRVVSALDPEAFADAVAESLEQDDLRAMRAALDLPLAQVLDVQQIINPPAEDLGAGLVRLSNEHGNLALFATTLSGDAVRQSLEGADADSPTTIGRVTVMEDEALQSSLVIARDLPDFADTGEDETLALLRRMQALCGAAEAFS